jgi:DNA-binding PadR family transcriptional regulator
MGPGCGVARYTATWYISWRYSVTMPDYPRRVQAAQHLPLSVPVFQILLSLCDQVLHGYAIIQDVRQRTGGEVALTASTLYAAIKRLLDAGLIEELSERPDEDDARRRYYRILPAGLDVARLEAARLDRAVKMARQKRLIPRRT